MNINVTLLVYNPEMCECPTGLQIIGLLIKKNNPSMQYVNLASLN